MTDDHVYLALAEEHEGTDARWAFGTGFEDPLHGVDTDVPAGVDTVELAAACTALGDDALVSAQRLAEWCTNAPELEDEVALANIGLDLLGQARLLYTRAGQVDGTGRGEDDFAYLREASEFRNLRLAELPNGDFAFSVARLLVFSTWRLALFTQLAASSPDPVLSAIAAKAVKETTYHLRYAADWTVRLGDGTELSARKMGAAMEQVAVFLDEVCEAGAKSAVDAVALREAVIAQLRHVCDVATLVYPAPGQDPLRGRDGQHTEYLAPLIEELQSLARALPGAVW